MKMYITRNSTWNPVHKPCTSCTTKQIWYSDINKIFKPVPVPKSQLWSHKRGTILLNKHREWNLHLTFQFKCHMPKSVLVTWKEWVIIWQYVVEDLHFKSIEIPQPTEFQFITWLQKQNTEFVSIPGRWSCKWKWQKPIPKGFVWRYRFFRGKLFEVFVRSKVAMSTRWGSHSSITFQGSLNIKITYVITYMPGNIYPN